MKIFIEKLLHQMDSSLGKILLTDVWLGCNGVCWYIFKKNLSGKATKTNTVLRICKPSR